MSDCDHEDCCGCCTSCEVPSAPLNTVVGHWVYPADAPPYIQWHDGAANAPASGIRYGTKKADG